METTRATVASNFFKSQPRMQQGPLLRMFYQTSAPNSSRGRAIQSQKRRRHTKQSDLVFHAAAFSSLSNGLARSLCVRCSVVGLVAAFFGWHYLALRLLFVESTGALDSLVAEPRLGRRTTLTLPLFPPPQKNRSAPSDSSPETYMPCAISTFSRTLPVRGSTLRNSLSSPSEVACQSSPSTQVTPVTNRFDSIVRRIAPVSGSI
jgi:hypothetical protein